MSDSERSVYIISDLHIGGRYATSDKPGRRGFRMNTRVDALTEFVLTLVTKCASGTGVELVINGDFLDFLAEEDSAGKYAAFVDDPVKALERFKIIVERDQPFFDALRMFVETGSRLTLLLGNHDIELSLPLVRRELMRTIGADAKPSQVAFFYDGEAYTIGSALIEHGNRYDGFNIVNHDGLRELRSLQSRGQRPTKGDQLFQAPPGSELVASIMNPIKDDYSFVDLLKPETEAVIPLLLALEPDCRSQLPKVLGLKHEAHRHAPIAPGMPRNQGDLVAPTDTRTFDQVDIVESTLATVMPADLAQSFMNKLPREPASGNLAARGEWRSALSLTKLLLSNQSSSVEERLPSLMTALQALHSNRSFDPQEETGKAYSDAAKEFVRIGFQFVVFGHTHLAKDVDLGSGCRYLNSGTWADLIEFPIDIVRHRDMNRLRNFVEDMANNQLDAYIKFVPTYVRLEVEGERVNRATLERYVSGGAVP